MRETEIRRMAAAEGRHWWYRSQRIRILDELAGLAEAPAGSRLLDAGCGTGGLLRSVGRRYPHLDLFGVDISPAAIEDLAGEGLSVHLADVADLPFDSGVFDAVISSDVLTSEGLDVRRALSEFRRVLAPGGTLVLNLPATPDLLSEHDRNVGQDWRAERDSFSRLLEECGFTVHRSVYWNWILLPVLALRRRITSAEGLARDVDVPLWPMNVALAAVLGLERLLDRRGMVARSGASLLVRATA